MRLRTRDSLEGGSYLLAVRLRRAWLPALAGVPGCEMPDAYGACRAGLAELMVLGRPMASGDSAWGVACSHVTHLPEAVLRQHFARSAEVEVVNLRRLCAFAPGLNAGRWLEAQVADVSRKAEGCMPPVWAEPDDCLVAQICRGSASTSCAFVR